MPHMLGGGGGVGGNADVKLREEVESSRLASGDYSTLDPGPSSRGAGERGREIPP